MTFKKVRDADPATRRPKPRHRTIPQSPTEARKDEPPATGRTGRTGGVARSTLTVLIPLAIILTTLLALMHACQDEGERPDLSPPSPAFDASCRPPELSLQGTECIGLRKGKGVFTTAPGGGDDTGDRQVNEIWGKIVEENAEVESKGRPYVTIIVAARFSSIEHPPGRDANDLFGALLAMREWNDDVAKHPFLIRLWAVNIGGASKHIDKAVDIILRTVAKDPNVVAVTDLGQTRSKSEAAARRLGEGSGDSPGFPMIASTQSGDVLSRLPYYFRVAPPDQRQADAGMSWALAERTNVQPYSVQAAGDTWSEGLIRNYWDRAMKLGIQRKDRAVKYDSDSGRILGANEFEVERLMCGDPPRDRAGTPIKDAPRLVVYSGRVDDLYILLRELNGTSCAENITVLGGDALAGVQYPTFKEKVREQLSADRVKLFYTTFGPESNEEGRELAESGIISFGWNEFFPAYIKLNEEFRKDLRQTANPSPEVQAEYDAVKLAAHAVELARRCNTESAKNRAFCRRMEAISTAAGGSPYNSRPNGLPNRPQVYAALRLTTGDQSYFGVTGSVDFGPPGGGTIGVEGTDPVEKLIILHKVTPGRAEDEIDVHYICSSSAQRPKPYGAPSSSSCY
jgi:hypothetical protein